MSSQTNYSAWELKHEHQRRWMLPTCVSVSDMMYPSERVYVGAFVVNTRTLLPLGLTRSREKVQAEFQSSCCPTFLIC